MKKAPDVVRDELFPDPCLEPVRAKGKKVCVEIFGAWYKGTKVESGRLKTFAHAFQRKLAGFVIIERDVEAAQ